MKNEEFYQMLYSKQYNELEKRLQKEYDSNKNLEAKYKLVICYG